MCDVGVLEIRIQLRVKMVKVDPFLWGDGQHVWMTLKFDLWLDLYGLQSDWWYTYPSEKKNYESRLGLLFPIYGKNKSCSKPPTSNDQWRLFVQMPNLVGITKCLDPGRSQMALKEHPLGYFMLFLSS